MSDGIRLTHVGVCVSNLDKSLAFYTGALGFAEVRRMHVDDAQTSTLLGVDDLDLDLVYLERDGMCIELLSYRRPKIEAGDTPRPMDAVGLTHLSLRVREPDVVADRIVAGGGRVLRDREVVFDGGARGLMALDPDGNRIELIEWRSP